MSRTMAPLLRALDEAGSCRRRCLTGSRKKARGGRVPSGPSRTSKLHWTTPSTNQAGVPLQISPPQIKQQEAIYLFTEHGSFCSSQFSIRFFSLD
jgi:hypothetical protein